MNQKKIRAVTRYKCPKCSNPFHYQMHRSLFMELMSFIIPNRKYFCAKCMKARYVRVKKHADE